MRKCFKKIFGAMSVCSILTGSVGIGTSAYEFNAVPVGSVPGMTEEEVKLMNAIAELNYILNEMVRTDSSQWGKFSGRIKELNEFFQTYEEVSYVDRVWKNNCSKNSEWTNADHAMLESFRIINSTKGLLSKLQRFLMDLGL